MRLRRIAPLVVLGATVVVLVVPLAIGSAPARLGAAVALAGLLAGLAGTVRQHRVEHGDDDPRPSLPALIVDSVERLGVFWMALGAYVAVVFLAAAASDSGAGDERSWFGPFVAVTAGAALVVAMVWTVRSTAKRDGVERAIFHQSAAVAFVLTVVAAALYGLFEAFAGAPQISMWAVWIFGSATFGVASSVVRRRSS